MAGSNLIKRQPVLIEKTILDGVVQVAAGRFHSMAIRKRNEGDDAKDDEQEDAAGGDGRQSAQDADQDNALADKIIIKDIKHDLFGWGRGYHG